MPLFPSSLPLLGNSREFISPWLVLPFSSSSSYDKKKVMHCNHSQQFFPGLGHKKVYYFKIVFSGHLRITFLFADSMHRILLRQLGSAHYMHVEMLLIWCLQCMTKGRSSRMSRTRDFFLSPFAVATSHSQGLFFLGGGRVKKVKGRQLPTEIHWIKRHSKIHLKTGLVQ